jgi:hypothetical protein
VKIKIIIKEAAKKTEKLPYNPDKYPLDEPYFRNKLKALGYDPTRAKVLGEGTQGTAFLLKNGKVLKITEDQTEAKASAIIAGKMTNNLVRVERVFLFGKTGLYGIVMENLEPLSGLEEDFWDNFRDLFEDIDPGKTIKWKELQSLIYYKLQDDGYEEDEIYGYLDEAEENNLPQIINELYKYGIVFWDYHGKNLMKRGNQTVLIDLGYSNINKNPKIPILEKNK